MSLHFSILFLQWVWPRKQFAPFCPCGWQEFLMIETPAIHSDCVSLHWPAPMKGKFSPTWLMELMLINWWELCLGFCDCFRLVCCPTKEKQLVYGWINSLSLVYSPKYNMFLQEKSIILVSQIMTSQKSIMWCFFLVIDITTLFVEKWKAATKTRLVNELVNSEKIWSM